MTTAGRGRFWHTLPYSLVILGLALIVLAVFNPFLQARGPAGTSSPIDDLPQLRTATDLQVERLLERLELRPADQYAYTQLGSAYLQKARETGDPSYYDRAEGALTKALELQPDNPIAMTVMGTLALARHEFQDAQKWAHRSLELSTGNAAVYGVLGDAQVELGQYDAAVDTFQTMVDLKPNLDSYARVSYIRELMGDVDGAIEAMQMAVSAGPPGTETTAWARMHLGNLYFNSGRVDEAQEHYENALRDFKGYYLALAALGNVRAAQGRLDEAISLYERSVNIIPQPSALAALGDLYAQIGEPDKARLQYDTVGLIGTLSALNKQIYNRELAVFYADHDIKLDEALRLASNEIEVRRDIYGYDALAWALYKNGRLDEAAEAISEAMKLGAQDAILFYHAGMIYWGLGQEEQARGYLEKALRLNPHFSILQAQRARETLELITSMTTSERTTEVKAK